MADTAFSPPLLQRAWRSIGRWRSDLLDSSDAQRRFWVLVLLTGAASGLGAAALVKLLVAVQSLVWQPGHSLREAVIASSSLHRILTLGLGGLLVVIVATISGRPLSGHGTAGIIEAIWLREGRYSLGYALLRGAMTIVAVACGAPLGREGALLSTGAGVGSFLSDRFKLQPDQTRVLVACGAASGIAAAYNVPVGAALFGLEILLGSFVLELLGPIVVSCVVATMLSRILVESHPTYVIPYYRLGRPLEILRFVALAPLFGLASAIYVRAIEGFATFFERFKGVWLRMTPLLAMLVVGVLACWLPSILGNGYDAVNDALLGHFSLGMLLILPVAKLLATALCSGARVPGGLFTPSLFFGAMLGGAMGRIMHFGAPDTAPVGAYALVGMAAILAGTTHAAVTAVLIIFELTRDYGVILPLMLTCVISAAVARYLEPESLYTGVLRRRKVLLPQRPQPAWMNETFVDSLVTKEDLVTVPPGMAFSSVLMQLIALPPGSDLYVVDATGRYLGVIVLDDIKGHLPDQANLGSVVAADVMSAGRRALTARMTLAAAAVQFAETYLDKLPVVDAHGHLIGTASKRDLMRKAQF
jgi:CIC family chloride channel protein